MRVSSWSAKVLYVLGERYTNFTDFGNAEDDAADAVESLKQKIIRRLSDRDSFVSWKKTHMMLRLLNLKNARQDFRRLETRVAYQKSCDRKRAAYARADKERALAAYTRAC
jgi:hypothetical protein